MDEYQCDDLDNMQCGWCEHWCGKCDSEGQHSAFEKDFCDELEIDVAGGFVCRDFLPRLDIKRAYVNLIAQQQKRREAEGG